jgi:hypothetical protein
MQSRDLVGIVQSIPASRQRAVDYHLPAVAPTKNDPPPFRFMAQRNHVFWAVWAVVAGFGTYYCMNRFRKPFTAAGYPGVTVLALLSRYAFGFTLLVTMFWAATILPSMRADFAREIWTGLGRPAQPSLFTQSEIYVALGVLAVNGCAVAIRDNRRAFCTTLATCALGFVRIAAGLIRRQTGALASFGLMVTVGPRLYLSYVAIHKNRVLTLPGHDARPRQRWFPDCSCSENFRQCSAPPKGRPVYGVLLWAVRIWQNCVKIGGIPV